MLSIKKLVEMDIMTLSNSPVTIICQKATQWFRIESDPLERDATVGIVPL